MPCLAPLPTEDRLAIGRWQRTVCSETTPKFEKTKKHKHEVLLMLLCRGARRQRRLYRPNYSTPNATMHAKTNPYDSSGGGDALGIYGRCSMRAAPAAAAIAARRETSGQVNERDSRRPCRGSNNKSFFSAGSCGRCNSLDRTSSCHANGSYQGARGGQGLHHKIQMRSSSPTHLSPPIRQPRRCADRVGCW